MAVALHARPVLVPDPPSGLLVASSAAWEAFWRSEVAGAVDLDSDLGRLRRWIRDVDEYERALREFRRKRLVAGSTGQLRLNPLAGRMKDLEASISAAENQFGMTPLSRLRLGVAVGQAALTAAEVNRLALGDGES